MALKKELNISLRLEINNIKFKILVKLVENSFSYWSLFDLYKDRLLLIIDLLILTARQTVWAMFMPKSWGIPYNFHQYLHFAVDSFELFWTKLYKIKRIRLGTVDGPI